MAFFCCCCCYVHVQVFYLWLGKKQTFGRVERHSWILLYQGMVKILQTSPSTVPCLISSVNTWILKHVCCTDRLFSTWRVTDNQGKCTVWIFLLSICLPLHSSSVMDTLMNTAIQAEYSSPLLSLHPSPPSELNEAERAKLDELTEANKGLLAPLCEDYNFKVGASLP